MKRYLLNILFAILGLVSNAQGLRVSAPSHVATGENFRLVYVISTQDASDIHMGNIPEALELITGPFRSSQSSYQVINGHASSSSSTTYTFILCATKSGTYNIPAATVVANGHRYTSHAVKINVSGKNVSASGTPKMHDSSSGEPRMRSAGSAISGKDLFIKVTASKNRVYEQEPVVLTYKVYTLVDLNELKGDMPDLTGFHTLEVPLPQQKSFHIENYNGRPYRCVTWSQYIMYPQMHGALKIPSIVFKGSIVQQNKNVDPVEAFFNGGSAYVEVKKDIVAPGLTLNVLPLPTKPSNFSGGVGTFNISAQLNKTDIRSNDPFTLRVVISGRGNLKLIKQPTVKFPKDFDKYDPKVTDKTKITGNGLEGNMIYDFIAVPRNQGTYTIPSVEFVYFDTNTSSYKTIKTQPFTIDVKKGSGESSSVDDYSEDMKNKDIRQIKDGEMTITDMDHPFFNSAAYWAVVLSVIVLSIIIAYLLNKFVASMNDTTRRVKGANRVALKRLRKADELMLHGDKATFYEEVLKALMGYVEEKFSLTAEERSRENIEKVLAVKNIDKKLVEDFISIIDTCEMEHYSPSSTVNNMNDIFEKAMNTITSIEESLKSKKKHLPHTAILLVIALFMTAPVYSVTKENADTEYRKGNYQQAIKDYNELLKSGKSAELYYNLGNAYYRTDNITQAILSYERASLLSPGDDDIQYNLKLAQSKTIDKISSEPQMILVQWANSVVDMMKMDSWGTMSVVTLVIAIVALLVYLFTRKIFMRKIGFYTSVVMLLTAIISYSCAYSQQKRYQERRGAIVVSPSVQLKKTPDEKGGNAAVVHEGTKVEIIDDSMKEWKHVRLGDDRDGWLHVSQIERI